MGTWRYEADREASPPPGCHGTRGARRGKDAPPRPGPSPSPAAPDPLPDVCRSRRPARVLTDSVETMDARGNAGMLASVSPELTVSSPLARPSRWLAPLAVAGALVWLTTVGFGGGRTTIEASVRTRWGSPVEGEGIERELTRYLERYGTDPDARWFAIEALARVGRPAAAVDVAAGMAGFAGTPGALKRLAMLLLDTLGWDRADPSKATWLYSRTVLARLEAGDTGARAELDRLVAQMPSNMIIRLFMPAMRAPGGVASTALGEALARRKEVHEFRAAGAILLAGPDRREDVPFLVELLRSPWREDRRPMWQQVARTLGVTGDPRGVEALALARADAPEDAAHARNVAEALDVGLALAERPDARERVMSKLPLAEAEWMAILYAIGLLTRWAHGDDGALVRMEEVWKAEPADPVRVQLLYGCVMAEKPPTTLPLAAWADLAAGSADPLAKAVGLVWRFRQTAPGSGDALLELLRASLHRLGPETEAGGETPEVAATLDILRAFARWG